MKLQVKLAALLIFSFLLSSCTIFPTPDKTVAPPGRNTNISSRVTDVNAVVGGFLPKGSSLLTVQKGNDSSAAVEVDMDGDGTKEIVVTYKNEALEPAFMVLKKGDEKWEKVSEPVEVNPKGPTPFINGGSITGNSSGYEFGSINKMDFIDVTCDGLLDIIVNLSGALLIYNYDGKNYRLSLGAIGSYTIEDIEGMDGKDGSPEVIIKNTLNSSDLFIYVLRWDGMGFSDDILEYPQYTKEVVDFYALRTKESPKDIKVWYDISVVQHKYNMYNELLKSTDSGLKLEDKTMANGITSYKNSLNELRALALTKLGRYEEARDIFNKLDERMKKSCLAMIYIKEGNYEKAREIYLKDSKFPYPDEVQNIDVMIAQNEINKYLKTVNPDNLDALVLELPEKFRDKGLIINCVKVESAVANLFPAVLVDFHLNPSKAYGRENIGGYVLYWWEGNSLKYQYIFGTAPDALSSVPPQYPVFSYKAAQIITNKNNTPQINITFENKDNPRFGNNVKVKLTYRRGEWIFFWN